MIQKKLFDEKRIILKLQDYLNILYNLVHYNKYNYNNFLNSYKKNYKK